MVPELLIVTVFMEMCEKQGHIGTIETAKENKTLLLMKKCQGKCN